MGEIDQEQNALLEDMLAYEEPQTDRMARVRRLSDAELKYAHQLLSDHRKLVDNVWLPLFEEEMRDRGLIQSH